MYLLMTILFNFFCNKKFYFKSHFCEHIFMFSNNIFRKIWIMKVICDIFYFKSAIFKIFQRFFKKFIIISFKSYLSTNFKKNFIFFKLTWVSQSALFMFFSWPWIAEIYIYSFNNIIFTEYRVDIFNIMSKNQNIFKRNVFLFIGAF